MTIRHRVGLAAAVAGSAIAGTVLPSVAHAADQSVLFVDNTRPQSCSDTGGGTQDQPFCTVQAAVDAAQPGQTVQVKSGGEYLESVTVKHSGLPGQPITVKADIPYGTPTTTLGIAPGKVGVPPAAHALVFSGVHDITVSGFRLEAAQESVLVQDSERITLNRDTILGGNPAFNGTSSFPGPTPALRITGKSNATTVSRSTVASLGTVGVAVEAGVTGTVVTTNNIGDNAAGGITVTDAPGTVVASNTFAENCGNDVLLTGNSSGSTVVNNVITKVPAGHCSDPALKSAAALSVSADSVTGTRVDYNSIVPAAAGGVGYQWGATSYTTAADFRATGQGAHDNAVNPKYGYDYKPTAAEGLTDAADATAPGMLDTDLYGNPRADDPQIANTGTGPGYYDRGAVELQDETSVSVRTYLSTPAGHPLHARLQVQYTPGWAPDGAKLDFGDGSEQVTLAQGDNTLEHDYPASGTYTATATATTRTGLVRTAPNTFTIAPVPAITVRPWAGTTDVATARVSFQDNTTSPWPVTRYTVDFGDGSAPVVTDGPTPPTGLTHDYGVGGTYSITETVLDDHGRTTSASASTRVNGPQRGVPFAGYLGGPTTQVGIFDNGRWHIDYNKTNGTPSGNAGFGDAGDIPVVGAWENTCQCQLGIYRPSTATFALLLQNGSVVTVPFGQPGDIPVVGAWDRNGHDQLAIYRPSTRTLAVRHDNTVITTFQFGDNGDLPIVGDWDGVHHAQFGLFRPGHNPGESNTFILRHDDGSISTASFGATGDVPVVGDWQRTGRTTYGIFRPSSHTFALNNPNTGAADPIFTLYY
ncbi:right-handed parallel beta-helix repeat-containing protein [Kitasatospora sp. NPDC051170]|uniref:right-handed parallel beta-helix repeat-containing protein n=1 Tax=Kitasatospora sp. NPDC051170 TaxID=3364056 RepID=UPI0037B70AB1